MNTLTIDRVNTYMKIYKGIDHFTPPDCVVIDKDYGTSTHRMGNINPAQILESHLTALSWLSENKIKFCKLKSEVINGPKECIYGFDMTAEEITKSGIINEDACIKYLKWNEDDVDFYRSGHIYEATLRRNSTYYKAIIDLIDGVSGELDRILEDLELKELQRKRKIYEKYYQKGMIFGELIRDIRKKMSIF